MDQQDRASALLVNAIVFVLVRVCYFCGSFLCLSAGGAFLLGILSRRRNSSYDPDDLLPAMLLFQPEFWIGVLVLSLIAALFGPAIYQRSTLRGRGTLRDLREDKVYDGD